MAGPTPSAYSRPVSQGADSLTLEGNGELRASSRLLRLPPATSPPVAPTAWSRGCAQSVLPDGSDSFDELGQVTSDLSQKPLGAAEAVDAANTTPAAASASFPATERTLLLFIRLSFS